MPPILESLIPVFLTIALGWGVRASGTITPDQWQGFERVTYFVLIPALVITTLAMADLRNVPIFSVGITLFLPTLLIGLCLFAARPWLETRVGVGGPAFTSLLQGAVRWNSFVAIALAGALHGKEGVALTAVAFAFLIPIANLMSAYALARFGAAGKALNPAALALTLAKNPFIWSTFIGIALAIIQLPIPRSISTFGDVVGRASLAAGLLLVGAGLDLRDLKRTGPPFWISSGLKLVAMPAMAFTLGKLAGLQGTALAVPMICASVPTAAASYILARQNGGDAPLMASIITGQTIAAALTMPLALLAAG
jgi:predicted permease